MGRFTATVCGLIVAAALLSLAAACGGDDGGQTTSATVTGTATADLSAVEARLREMVLQPGDLPEGYGSGEEEFVTNEDASTTSADPARWVAQLDEWGRVLGIDVYFEPETDVAVETGIFQVDSTAAIYESVEGASASFDDEVEAARATDWAALFGMLTDVQVEELPSPALTDGALWLRVTGKAGVEEEVEQILANDLLIFRQGSARGGLMIGSVVSPASSQTVDEMVRAQAERLIEAAD